MVEASKRLDKLMTEKSKEMRKKYKQFCFLNKLTYSDDVFNTTYLKVREILDKGKKLKDESDKGIENYFFLAFKRNTYLEHKKEQKSLMNIEMTQAIEDSISNDEYEDTSFIDNCIISYILDKISLEFDSISVRCWKIKRLITIEGKQFTYDDIRRMTHILDAKKRITYIDKWIKSNINLSYLRDNLCNV